jgi:biopolymer transport protein TolR
MSMQMPGSNQRRPMMSEINVTPMVDVMLVLLVIFMVTAPLLHEGIKVNLPNAEGKEIESEEKNITLTVDKDGGLYVTLHTKGEKTVTKEVKPDDLEEYLKSIYANRVDKKIFVEADSKVDYGEVVAAIAKAKAAGAEQLGLMTKPDIKPPIKTGVN